MRLNFVSSLEFAAQYAKRTGRTDPADVQKALHRYEQRTGGQDPLTITPLDVRYAGQRLPKALKEVPG